MAIENFRFFAAMQGCDRKVWIHSRTPIYRDTALKGIASFKYLIWYQSNKMLIIF
jgi:hypothetical protein